MSKPPVYWHKAKKILSSSKVDIIPADNLKDAATKVVNEAIKDKV